MLDEFPCKSCVVLAILPELYLTTWVCPHCFTAVKCSLNVAKPWNSLNHQDIQRLRNPMRSFAHAYCYILWQYAKNITSWQAPLSNTNTIKYLFQTFGPLGCKWLKYVEVLHCSSIILQFLSIRLKGPGGLDCPVDIDPTIDSGSACWS